MVIAACMHACIVNLTTVAMRRLPSDHVLPEDDECLQLIKLFATSSDEFFKAFGPAYVKLTCLGATWT